MSPSDSAGWWTASSPGLRYGCALVATLLALLLKLALGPIILPSLYVPFYGAVLVSAWVGGVGPGVVASVLSFAIGQVLFSPPLSPPPSDAPLAMVRDALFLLAAVGLSWGTAALHASQRRVAEVLQAARDELESHVAVRTAELREANQRLTDEMARRSEAEERFRNAFEYAPIGMALITADGQPLQINAALCRMLGYEHDELVHKPIAELMHPDDFAAANADRARLLSGAVQSYQAERRYLHRSGSTVWVEMHVSVVRDHQGRALNLVSHLHDITERKLADAALQKSEGKFRTLAETVPVATVIFQGAAIRYANPGAAALTGYTCEELLAMSFWDVVHPEDREMIRQRGLARQRGEELPAQDETRLVTKSGETRWVVFSAAMIDFEGGRAALGTAFDVTERRQAEETLRRSEELVKDQARWLQSILNSLGEAVVVADDTGKLMYFNPVAERLHGRGVEDIAPENWSREYGVYFPDGTPVPPEKMPLAQATHGTATTANQEFVIRRSGQETLVPVSVTATPLVAEDGSLRGGVVVYRDISNIKEAEARLRRNEERLREAERLAHAGAWEWDLTTNEVVWSDEQFRIFGLEPRANAPDYDSFLQMIHLEDRQRIELAIQDALAGRLLEVECRIERPHGEIRHVSARGEVVRDAAGKAIRMWGTVVDITEQKHAESVLESRVAQRTMQLQEANRLLQEEIRQRREAEAALRDSEQRFRATFEQAAVGVSMVGPDGCWLMVNDRLCQILGYDRDELMQLTFRSITYPEDLPASLNLVGQLVSGQTKTFTTEKRYVRKDGSLIWGSMTGSAVRDAAGNFKYGIAIIQDINARKQAEREVRTAEQRLRRLVEHLPAITYVLALDDAQSTLYISPQLETTLGFTPAEWTRDPELWNEQLHPDDRQRVATEVAASHATGAPFSSEYRMYARDGTLRWFHDEAAVIRDATGQLLFSQGVMIDITARKRAEEELEAVNRRTRDILEEITDGFYSLDLEGRFTYLNPSALRLFERSADDLLGKRLWDAFPEGIGSPFEEQYQQLMTERVPVSVEAYFGPRNRWYRAHAYPTHQGASVLFEDVTERHQLEAATVSDILGALNAHLEVADAFPAVAVGLHVLTHCDHSSIFVFEDDEEWMRMVALDDARVDLRGGVRLRIADVPTAQEVLDGRPHIVRDLATERRFTASRRLYAAGYRSRLSVPLQGRERVLGILNLLWREPDGPSTAQLPLINQVGAMVALALEKGRLFDEVRAGHERLEALSLRLLQVQEAERQHIARELHDEIGQALTALKLSLDTVRDVSLEDVPARLDETHRQVSELLGRVRNLALDLRPAMLDDLGLLPALLWLFERYSVQASMQVNFEHRGLDGRFNPEIETAAYRIVQEALTNVTRHAGVREVTVRSWSDGGSLSVQIVDHGVGFDAQAALAAGATTGVAGMRERVSLLAGHFAVESTPGKGTRVSAELPLNGSADDGDGVAICR